LVEYFLISCLSVENREKKKKSYTREYLSNGNDNSWALAVLFTHSHSNALQQACQTQITSRAAKDTKTLEGAAKLPKRS